VHRFFEWASASSTQPRVSRSCSTVAETRAAAQVELLETLLATLGATSDFQPSRRDYTRQTQSRIVKSAEDYVLAHIGDRLYVTDLCKAQE